MSAGLANPTNEDGIIWKWDGEPFGSSAATEDPDANAIKFSYNWRLPGQLYDPQGATHYNTFRDYNPKTGRYLQSDPIGLAGGINTYAYVGGNPLSYSDPNGLNPGTGAGALVGSFIAPGLGTAVGAAIGTGIGVGIGYLIYNSRGNPIQGPPGEWVTSPNGRQDRKYGSDGFPEVDIDRGHDHGAGDPHAHNWGRPAGGGKPTIDDRGPGVPVSPLPDTGAPNPGANSCKR